MGLAQPVEKLQEFQNILMSYHFIREMADGS